MAQQREVAIGRTGSAEYFLKGMWVYRRPINGTPYRYDTAEGFAKEWESGAFGGSWRDTPEGRHLLDRFTTH
jgi:hypothetical protein